MFKNFHSGIISTACLLTFISLIITIFTYLTSPFSEIAFTFSLIWTLLAVGFLTLTYKSQRVGLLLAIFCLLTVIRILGINNLFIAAIPILMSFLALIVLFFYIAYHNVIHFEISQKFPYGIPVRLNAFEYHLTFIRLYIGYDLIGHFAEKLFAGPISFNADVKAFIHLGITYPCFTVTLAGLCELGGAIAIGLGFFTRIGSIGTTLYILISTVLGKHFHSGFIWANPGGGWEYPVMWGVLLLSFAVLGAGKYSIDAALQQKFALPTWILKLMGQTS